MSKIAGEINAEMMHPKVIHEQRKALFAEMVRKTGSQQSVMDRLVQEIQFLREQVAMLREALISARTMIGHPDNIAPLDKALAATEPK